MTKFAAVLGSPIKHSLSPVIHNRAYEILGVDAKYSAVEIRKDELGQYISQPRLQDSLLLGYSLTMPLKEEICSEKFADFIKIDERSQRIRSANTLFRKDDQWWGTSTDVSGIEYLLHDLFLPSVAILGAGGTARAALAAHQLRNSRITIYRRNSDRDATILKAFPDQEIVFQGFYEVKDLQTSTLVVNTVPDEVLRETEIAIPSGSVLLDAIYSPWQPSLSRRWSESGGEVITGIDLLCAQALDQISLMTGLSFSKPEIFVELKKVALEQIL